MDQGPRYAIYFVPAAQSRFYHYGSAILGYDCRSGAAVDFPSGSGSARINWRELSHEARRYGFHATLKAPFHLLSSHGEPQLINALQNFARLGHAVHSFAPTVRLLGGFFAVVPQQAESGLDALAASCTTIFDACRAPITPQERARRVALKLNEEQIRNLDRWGYPYVLSEFRFHMTLTGKVPQGRQEAIGAALQTIFRQTQVERTIAVDHLALVKQDAPEAAFRVVSEVALNTRP